MWLSYFFTKFEQNQGHNKGDKKCTDGSHKDASEWIEEIDSYCVTDDTRTAVDHTFCHRTGKLRSVFSHGDEHG